MHTFHITVTFPALMTQILGDVTLLCGFVLASNKLFVDWLPLDSWASGALRFRWSAGYEACRYLGAVCAGLLALDVVF